EAEASSVAVSADRSFSVPRADGVSCVLDQHEATLIAEPAHRFEIARQPSIVHDDHRTSACRQALADRADTDVERVGFHFGEDRSGTDVLDDIAGRREGE